MLKKVIEGVNLREVNHKEDWLLGVKVTITCILTFHLRGCFPLWHVINWNGFKLAYLNCDVFNVVVLRSGLPIAWTHAVANSSTCVELQRSDMFTKTMEDENCDIFHMTCYSRWSDCKIKLAVELSQNCLKMNLKLMFSPSFVCVCVHVHVHFCILFAHVCWGVGTLTCAMMTRALSSIGRCLLSHCQKANI